MYSFWKGISLQCRDIFFIKSMLYNVNDAKIRHNVERSQIKYALNLHLIFTHKVQIGD